MAKETLRTISARSAPSDDARPEPPGLWQVPTFLLGALALLGVWQVRPYWYDPEARHVERSVAEVREILQTPRAPADKAVALAEEVLDHLDRFPQRAGEAHFLLGSAYLRLAATGPNPEAWQRARAHLEEAEALGVHRKEHPALLYRIGVALAHTGADPARVIDYLKGSIEQVGDDCAEGYGLLAEAYLHLPVPDLQAALHANEQQLAFPTDDENLLAPARLLRGELLLRMQQRPAARKVLQRIGPGAPPRDYARARFLLAQCFQEDGAWQEAARLWEEVLADRRTAPREPAHVLYFLGVCYRKLGRAVDAAKAWEGALSAGSAAGQAAALRLGDVRLEDGNRPAGLELFERALHDVSRAEEYSNPLLDLAEARQLLEAGCRVCREAGDYESGQRLAVVYGKVALPGMAQVQYALQVEARARGLAGSPPNAAGDPRPDGPAQAAFREAGDGYAAAADAMTDPHGKVEWLRRAAECYRLGNAPRQLIEALDALVQLPALPEQLGEAWFRLAEAYDAVHEAPAADAAYKKCIEYPGPFAYRARYHLAEQEIAQMHFEEAEEGLKQNLELMRLAPERDVHEKTLYTLARLLFRRSNFRAAVLRLQEALDHYPANPQALAARRELGQCYRELAALENQNLQLGEAVAPEARTHYRTQARLWLEKAVANDQRLADDLLGREAKTPLSQSETKFLAEVLSEIGDCWLELGRYERAIPVFELLAQRFAGRYEQLIAFKGLFRCHSMLNQPSEARAVLQRYREALNKLDDAAFRGRPEEDSRLNSERWHRWAEDQLRQF